MMQLLTPEKIKDDKLKGREEARLRVQSLADVEATLIASVNHLREEEAEQRKRAAIASNEADLAVKKSILAQEVEALEARKTEAMKPVRELTIKAEAVFEDNLRRADDLSNRERIGRAQENSINRRFEELTVAEIENAKKEDDLDIREEGIAKSEQEIKSQTEKLANDRTAFSIQTLDANTALEVREKNLAAAESTIETARVKQQERDADQNKRERQLKDRYATLESAQKEKQS